MNLRNRKETMGTLQLTCPIKGCEKIYTIVASLRAHLFRIHGERAERVQLSVKQKRERRKKTAAKYYENKKQRKITELLAQNAINRQDRINSEKQSKEFEEDRQKTEVIIY